MTNRTLDLQVRCRAAQVLGRCGFDNQTNLDILAWSVADLTVETAFAFSGGNTNRNNPMWAQCGWSLYSAFHHQVTAEAAGSPPSLPKGFLNRAAKSQVVRSAYTEGVGLMAHLMFNRSPAPKAELGKLFTWVQANRPANFTFDPACPALPAPAAPAQQAAPANGG
ncbi:MAG: hypothetical protein R3C49_20100 [Planctomycetaceae bacterium]